MSEEQENKKSIIVSIGFCFLIIKPEVLRRVHDMFIIQQKNFPSRIVKYPWFGGESRLPSLQPISCLESRFRFA